MPAGIYVTKNNDFTVEWEDIVAQSGDIVAIEWIDSTNRSEGWTEIYSIETPIIVINTIGYLVGANDKALTISHTIRDSGTHCYNLFSIPYGCIENFKVVSNALKKHEKGKRPGAKARKTDEQVWNAST